MLTELYKCAAGIWVGDESRVAEGRGFEGERRRTIQTRTGVTEGRVRCSSLRHHPPSPPCILSFFPTPTIHRHGRRCFRLDREIRSG